MTPDPKEDRMTDPLRCIAHRDADCDLCDRYEYRVEVEGREHTAWFWVGQDAVCLWGQFGDGIRLTYKPAVSR